MEQTAANPSQKPFRFVRCITTTARRRYITAVTNLTSPIRWMHAIAIVSSRWVDRRYEPWIVGQVVRLTPLGSGSN